MLFARECGYRAELVKYDRATGGRMCVDKLCGCPPGTGQHEDPGGPRLPVYRIGTLGVGYNQ
jgi:hypothetical protein